jgi:predicted permease
MLRSLGLRIAGLLRPTRAEEESRLELESHIAMHMDEGIRAGLTAAEARRQALIRLGRVEQTQQAYRERHGLPWLESLLRDLRFSFRTFARHPSVTAIAILSIALGIGANATIFSLVSRFVLRPAPVGNPSTLLEISTTHAGERCCNHLPMPVFHDIQDQARSFSGVAAYFELIPASIGGQGEPERVWGQGVTTNFFDVLQLPMVLGRGFVSTEESANVIVIGANLWRHRFNADPAIVGKTVLISGRTFTVAGIAPAAFRSVDQILYTQFWVPLGIASQLVPNLPKPEARDFHWLSVVARMRPEVSRVQVNAELNTLAGRLAQTYPATDKDNIFHIEQAGSLPPSMKSVVVLFLSALSVVVLLVLAIACANVANLLLAQAASRQREMAVRLALGATHSRLRRQMLIESLLLGVGGGLLGILLSFWSTRGLSTVRLPAPVPLDLGVGMDWRVTLFTLVLCVISGLLLGVAPAWSASRPLLSNALKGEDALARPGRRWTLRNLLVIGQIAMSVVLLSVTVLFLRSLQNASTIDIGFRPQNLFVLSIDPRVHGYSPERTSALLTQLRESVRALPGVVSAVCTDVPLLSGGNRSDGFSVSGQSEKGRAFTYADLYMVTPGYFDTVGTARLSGRDFGNDSATSLRTAVINKAFADVLFPGANPIGQHVQGGNLTYEIIGVVKNAKSRTVGEDTRPILYRSLDQSIADDPSVMGYTLVVQTAGSPESIAASVRRQVYALDPAMAIFNEETMEEHVRTAFFLPRVAAMLFGVFGGIGLVLAAVGLYGVMNYAVSRRTREIGIRMAMGAQLGAVQRLVVRQGMTLFAIALVLGWPAAWALSKLASSFLYGIKPHDALTFATVPVVLSLVALAASWIPARRAASINPTEALRAE